MKIIPSLTALLALTVTLTACKSDTAPPPTADLTITLKKVATAHVKVANATGEVSFDDTVTGNKTLTGLKRGVYTVTASNTDTYAAPPPQTADLSKGNIAATLEFSPLKGSLLIKVAGVPSAKVVIKDGAGKEVFADVIAGSKTLGDLPYGTYTVTPQTVDGQVTPDAQTVAVKGAATTTLTYSAIELKQASLTVSVSGVTSAPVTVRQGDKVLFEGTVTGSKVLADLPRGSVTVTAGAVNGFTAPATQTVDLSSGIGSAALTYTVVQATKASLTLTVTGVASAPIKVTQGTSVLFDGTVTGSKVLTDLPRTNVTVTAGAVDGYTPPAAQTVDLSSGTGSAALIYAVVQATKASLTLTVTGVTSAPIKITQGASVLFDGTVTGSKVLTELPRANVTVTAGVVDGYTPPAAQTVDLSSGTGSAALIYAVVQASSPTAILTLDSNDLTITPSGSTIITGKLRSSSGTINQADIFLDDTGNTAGLYLNAHSFDTLTEVPQNVTLTLNADTSAAAGQRDLSLRISSSSGVVSRVPLSVKVLSSGFTLELYPTSLNVYPGDTVNVPVTLSSVKGYSGPITLTASGLPKGVTIQPQTINLTGSSVSANLVLSASTDSPIAQVNFTVTAQGNDLKMQQVASLMVYPRSVRLPSGTPVLQLNTKNVDKQSSLWLASSIGFIKVTPNSTLSTVNSTQPLCNNVTVGEDGGIWSQAEPYTRLDPNTGTLENYPSPRKFSGCAGEYQFDAKRRDWETYFGIFRLDLVNQKSEKVPGTDNINGLLIVKDGKAWVNANNTLYIVDTDSLALKTYTVPSSSFYNFTPSNGKAYFLDNNQLAIFDPTTQTVNRIRADKWDFIKLYGLDKDGNAWLQGRMVGSGYRSALLRISPSGSVLKELPDLIGAYAPAPNGGIWFSANSYNDPRVAYIAP